MPKLDLYAEYLKIPKPVFKPGWLVLTKDGYQFSTHLMADRDRADRSAALIGGTVVPYTPIESTYWKEDKHYDH